MRTFFRTFLVFMAIVAPASAQDMMVQTTAQLVVDSSSSLSASRQDALAAAVRGQPSAGVVGLPQGTMVKVLNKAPFETKETLWEKGSPMPKDVKRKYQAAFVQVLDGNRKGEKGWTVLSYQDPGKQPVTYLEAGLASRPGGSTQTAAAGPKDGIDLIVSVAAGHISPTGGRLYEVNVINKGTVEAKGNFEVVVEIDGKIIKTERLRGPLKPHQAVSFTLPLGDSILRKKGTIKATVDPKNAYQETSKDNNTSSTQLSP